MSSEIVVERGPRQGDPLSPYLFIICINVLSCLIANAERREDCQGIKFSRRGPAISHLLYADDLILFFKADNESPFTLNGILHDFCSIASLSIKIQKSNLILSPNTPRLRKIELINLFRVEATNKLGKYLGVFVDDKNDLKRNFDDLLHKIENRLAGWKIKLLSQAGRLTLIKSVIQSDPVYKLSCFKASRKVTDAINSTMTNFF